MVTTLQDFAAKKLWYNDYAWPLDATSVGELLQWVDNFTLKNDKKLVKLKKELTSLKPSTLVHKTQEWYRGKELRDVLKLIPLDTRAEKPIMWPPNKVSKIVLMSATINKPDVDSMGLGGRRVAYIDVQSPIAPFLRPIVYDPVGNMSFVHQAATIPLLGQHVSRILAQYGSKGLIHAPYSVMRQLIPLLSGEPRLMWHDRDNKQEVLQEFRDSDPAEGRVLMGSGMYEGLDLPYDQGRWQIICKVPYPSLVDPGIKAKLQEDQQWYNWQTIKTILQASGRICRTPTDRGTTFIVDSSFEKLYNMNRDLFPSWYTSALKGIKG